MTMTTPQPRHRWSPWCQVPCLWDLFEPREPDVWSLGIPAHQHLTAAAVDPELVLR